MFSFKKGVSASGNDCHPQSLPWGVSHGLCSLCEVETASLATSLGCALGPDDACFVGLLLSRAVRSFVLFFRLHM